MGVPVEKGSVTMLLFYILAFCRIVIGLVFALSSLGKARYPAQFARTINQFHMLPPRLSTAAAWLFLVGEGAVVLLMLIGGSFLWLGFALAGCLLLVFSGALASVLIRGINTSCHCFGATTRVVSVVDVWRNAGLSGCAFGGWAAVAVTPDPEFTLALAEWGLIGAVAAVGVMIWLQLDQIAQLLRAS